MLTPIIPKKQVMDVARRLVARRGRAPTRWSSSSTSMPSPCSSLLRSSAGEHISRHDHQMRWPPHDSIFSDGTRRNISRTRPVLLTTTSDDIQYEGVSDDVSKLINDHARQLQTPVSLQALMRTGRGEFLDRHFEDVEVEEHTATDLVLIQVRTL